MQTATSTSYPKEQVSMPNNNTVKQVTAQARVNLMDRLYRKSEPIPAGDFQELLSPVNDSRYASYISQPTTQGEEEHAEY